jgi:cytochrome c553
MKRILTRLIIVALPLVFTGFVFAQGSAATAPLSELERGALFPTPNQIILGKGLSETACAGCHGLDGVSTDSTRPHLAGQRTIYLYRELQAYKSGDRSSRSMRVAVEYLSDDALLNAAIYYASLPPADDSTLAAPVDEEPMEPEYSAVEAGKSAAAGCAGCHGATGNSGLPGSPSLTAQDPEYFVTAMKAYQDGSRPHAMMQTLVSRLDDETIQNLAIYYAVQEPQRASTNISGDADAGRKAAEACGSCHGADGNTAASDTPSLAGQEARYLSVATLAYQNGQRDHDLMTSAVTGLSSTVIDDMSAFYAEQEPVQRQVRTPLTSKEWIVRCDRCHGQNGNSTDPRYASLAGQNEDYLKKVLADYSEQTRRNSMMHAMSAPLSPANIERIAAHYAAQKPKSAVYIQLPCEDTDAE